VPAPRFAVTTEAAAFVAGGGRDLDTTRLPGADALAAGAADQLSTIRAATRSGSRSPTPTTRACG
jgi:hypothetical protein